MDNIFANERTRCPASLSVSWVQIPPYIYNTTDGRPGGIFQKILGSMVKKCCEDKTNLIYSNSTSDLTQFQVVLQNGTDDIYLPVYGDGKQKFKFGSPFISIVDSPGIAYFYGNLGSAQEETLKAFATSWPVLVVVLLLAFTIGTAFYIAEVARFSSENGNENYCEKSTGSRLKNALSQSVRGPLHGFYWAMVTLTTVGYGDLTPKTVLGRIIAIIWILFGTVILSMFTASITSGLITAVMSNDIALAGAKVAVISESKEASIAIKKNAIPVDYSEIIELPQVLQRGETEGLLLDTYVAGYYQKSFEKFLLADVIEYVFTYGLLLRNKGIWMDSCFRLYTEFYKDQLFRDISTSIVPFKPLNYGNQASKKSSTLIDWTSRPLQMFLAGVGFLLFTMIICGISLTKYRKWKKSVENKGKNNANQHWNSSKQLQLQRLEHINAKCSAYYHMKEELTSLGKSIEELMMHAVEVQNIELERPGQLGSNMYSQSGV
ncbi:uncharacterized protein LOC135693392 isoform X2 [Rhopilema esculentum]|uniref:uncharacterized protein LOC135693392 isoform X2 n=1 Tax=Rhopilema esculentum TaxID=499914 RepID=UPI0031CDF7F9